MSSAVVLSSGGINSAVVLEIALRAHRPDNVYMVSAKYDSKSNDQDHLASLDLYSYYTDRGENITWEPLEICGPNVEPFINAILISRATAYAITKGASYIFVGIGENNEIEFLRAMALAVYKGSHEIVKLQFPLAGMTKTEVVKQAYDLEVSINLTWSCAQPLNEMHCGVCSSCKERIEGFKDTGYYDPVPYVDEMEQPGKVQWPYIGEKQLRAGKL